MREILFRGKRLDNGEWVEGDICHHDGIVSYIGQSPMDGSMVCYELDPSTVGQYTGLTDKNGKRIFEGDIVTRKWSDKIYRYKVVYKPETACFIGAREGGFTSFGYDGDYFEIIGNIHDNPELLKGGNEE